MQTQSHLAGPYSAMLTPYSIDSFWLDSVPKPRTLLVAYPHPDDESFGGGCR